METGPDLFQLYYDTGLGQNCERIMLFTSHECEWFLIVFSYQYGRMHLPSQRLHATPEALLICSSNDTVSSTSSCNQDY